MSNSNTSHLNNHVGDRKPITLITGTSRGIGAHLAEHYLKLGHTVLGLSRTEPEYKHPDYFHFAINISDDNAVRETFDQIGKQFGSLTNLINNAGISALNHSMLTSMDSVRKIFEVNYMAAFLISQESVRLMRKQKFGRIINFSTISVPLHSEGVAAYASSKSAIEELTRILAKELGEIGITVNCIGPSTIDTKLARGIPRHRVEELVKQQAVKREAEMDDVANLTDFFFSERSSLVTGQVIYLGGFS
jgi:3-oxoacyl-[acyl-carrier protein] reductase